MSEEKLCVKVARDMGSKAYMEQDMGVELTDIDEGFAKVKMTIKKEHLNGVGTCHGGTMFTLADIAFAYACNSRNILTVAQSCDISFVNPAYEGDVLTATANEKFNRGKSGIYDIVVTNQNYQSVAFFTGRSRSLNASVIEEERE